MIFTGRANMNDQDDIRERLWQLGEKESAQGVVPERNSSQNSACCPECKTSAPSGHQEGVNLGESARLPALKSIKRCEPIVAPCCCRIST